MFRETVYHIYIYAIVAWLLMNFLPRQQQHKAVMVFLLGYLSSQHIYSMLNDFGGFNMDITTYTMILVCKLWILSWAFKDGGMDEKKLTPDQLERRVVEFPSLIEYLSYVFFCCGPIVGPVFEFSDFKNFMELKGNYRTLPRGVKGTATIMPALTQLGGAFLCLGIHIAAVLLGGFDVYWCGTKEFITAGNIFYRIGFYFCAMTGQRFMYYTPWLFNDAATKACGLAYNGSVTNDDKTVTHKWDRVVSINVIALETGYTPIMMMADWNHTVHLWLKHYVQARLVEPGQKPTMMTTIGTFGVSAFWHGFYPFYYFMFFMCACFVELSKDIYRARALFSWVPYPTIVCNLLTMLVLNYLGTSFNCLTFERGFNFGAGTYYFVYIMLPVLVFSSKAFGMVKMAKKKEEKLKSVKKD